MTNIEVDGGGIFNGSDPFYDYSDDYQSPDDSEPKAGEAVWIPVVYSVVLVVGLLGNALLLAVLAQKRQSWSISDTFILNLGVADLLLLLTLPLWAVQAAHDSGWIFEDVPCKISGAVFNINFYCGIYLLLCICLDCCLSVASTTQLCFHQKPLFAHVTCALVWVISLLLTIPDWLFLGAETKEKTLCIHTYSETKKLWSRLPHHILGYLLPTVVIICCFRVLLQNRSKITQKKRAVKVILPLVLVFFLCWMPYNITLLVDTANVFSGNPQGALKTALMVTTALGCVHACLRPLLYVGLCLNFRKHSLAVPRCDRHDSKSSLWELGVGKEVPPSQNHEEQELKQMTEGQHQVQSA